ncbi:GNAT family N-acetyltransferase [Cytobacillus sp. NCCP-133]|uniref:GNAT family N-acetyltransferase n=1 Tax=Cytobacillus sp. NCCP-133 TaxID=766848 RepID=UPI0022324DF7|nr:GNAT family N-acetyltransferase [Cytobacillus sp. NCCP-133]GLB60354.1 hypothetical protein NCCP133_24860 [Cytobacillus sp. NCCP-133]
MAIGKIYSSLMVTEDWPFFLQTIKESPDWEDAERSGFNIKNFLIRYSDLNGVWRVWKMNGDRIAITFHVNSSPSNQKPWMGTILVKKELRRQGIGLAIIRQICSELKDGGEKSFFAGVPEDCCNWIDFLSEGGFEQFKVETSPEGQEYLIMVCPLI